VRPIPADIDGATVLQVADLSGTVATGRTRHVVDGADAGPFAGLAIAQYDGESGVYLFYCDPEWRAITDTFHETIEDAVKQAEFEYGAVSFAAVGDH
jgi:hypothetical protein